MKFSITPTNSKIALALLSLSFLFSLLYAVGVALPEPLRIGSVYFLPCGSIYLLFFHKTIFKQFWEVKSFEIPFIILICLEIVWLFFSFMREQNLTNISSQDYFVLNVSNVLSILTKVWILIRLFRIKDKPFLNKMRFWGYATMVAIIFTPLLPYLSAFSMQNGHDPESSLAQMRMMIEVCQRLPEVALFYLILSEPCFGTKTVG